MIKMNGKRYILLVAVIIMAIGFTLTFSYNMNNQVEKSGGFVIPKPAFSDGTHDLNSRIKSKNEPVINEFVTYLNPNNLESIEGNDFHVIIYRMNSQAYEVYFNDILIGAVGDMENGKSHTYNSSNSFSVKKSQISDTNKLTIRTYGIYMTGLEIDSVGVTDGLSARKINETLHLLTSGFSMAGIGAIILGIIISIMTYFKGDRKNKTLIYLSFAVLFLACYSLEYLNLPYLIISYVAFKKMIILFLYSCIFFFGLAFKEHYKKWFLISISSSVLAIVIVAAIFTKTLITFKYIYDITSIGLAASLLLWFLYSLLNKDDSEEHYIFLASTLMMLIIAISDTLLLFIVGGVVSTSIITHVMVFIFILVNLMNIDMHRRNVLISSESRQRSHFYKQSITDYLTGVFNKKYILQVLKKESSALTIAMLDLDNFKYINDTYGHQGGDYILEHVAAKMREEFRDTDIIGRYGGDEFIVILIGCSERKAFDIMNRFRMHLEMDKFEYDRNEIKLTTSVGIAFTRENPDVEKLIKNADQALYRAKDSGRNRVSI